jgi:hypothetical protein
MMKNINRVDIYVSIGDKEKLIKKAQGLGIPLSRLMVRAALEYGEEEPPKQEIYPSRD